MKMMPVVKKAMGAFPSSFINPLNELILIPKWNIYFSLDDVETEEDFLCKMCEWISRDCCKAERTYRRCYINAYHKRNTESFNATCETDFSVDDMMVIYQKLGNAVNHELTVKFVRSGFDLNILKTEVQENG